MRVKRICSKRQDFIKNAHSLCVYFLHRKYPPKLIIDALIKTSTKSRSELIKITRERMEDSEKLSQTKSRDLFLVTMFNPEYNGLKDIVAENWDLLKRSAATKVLAETRVTFGYRRPPNLKDILVRAKVPRIEATNTKTLCSKFCNRCSNKKCIFCPILETSGRIKSTFTGREYESKKNVTCRSSNLIYCITCLVCNKQYVGQTGDSIRKRFGAHFGSINRKNLKEDVGRHFNLQKHHGVKDLQITVLDFIHAHPKSDYALTLRLQIEFNWIQRLRTMLPLGLNTKDRTPKEEACRKWKHYRETGKTKST